MLNQKEIKNNKKNKDAPKIRPDKKEKKEGTPDITAKKASDFHIVGMGASAGGLDAFERFFRNMPDNS